MPESMRSIIAIVPEIIFVKYKAITITAADILIDLSAPPMFFFIVFFLKLNTYAVPICD